MPCTSTPFESIIWWPFLDFGNFGANKMLIGFDIIADAPEGIEVSVGYNQRDRTQRTTDFEMEGDSLDGTIVPLPVNAPSFDLRITFAEDQAWEWQAANIYIQDQRLGA